MLHAFAKLCSIGLLAFVAAGAPQAPPAPQAPQAPPAPQVPQAPDEIAFMAALALKQKAEHLPAAAAFAKFRADFPQSGRVLASQVEEGVCWFSAGRALQAFHKTTPEAQEKFDKALA